MAQADEEAQLWEELGTALHPVSHHNLKINWLFLSLNVNEQSVIVWALAWVQMAKAQEWLKLMKKLNCEKNWGQHSTLSHTIIWRLEVTKAA